MVAGLKLVNHIGQATYHLKSGRAGPDSEQKPSAMFQAQLHGLNWIFQQERY